MFDSRGRNSNQNNHAFFQQGGLSSIKDSISSIMYRIAQLQTSVSRKMDRSECLNILQKKASMGHLKQYTDELQSKIKEEQRQEEARNQKMQELAIQKINQLAQKMTNKKNKTLKDRVIRPQELFLQSNETMFSLLIDQISKLQQKDAELEKQLQNRNKRIINLNNQVCKKIEKLQSQIENKLVGKMLGEASQVKHFGNSWSVQMQRNSKPTINRNLQVDPSFQSLRFDILTKNIQSLQKQMLSKMNIKDVLPIIKQNTQSSNTQIQELKNYVQSSMESTRKILQSQTEINGELSLALKVGWWHSFEQQNQIAIINKELINLVPEIFELASTQHSPNFINVLQQGLYLIKIYPLFHMSNFMDHSLQSGSEQLEFQVMIGNEIHILGSETVLRLEKNSEVRVIVRDHSQIILYLQKI